MERKRGGASLPCPKCSGVTRVMETRRINSKTVSRLRICKTRKCATRFTSHEHVKK